MNRPAVLSLYRSILRTHAKSLPDEMRAIGDAYVKSEFQLHKSVTKEDQLERFFDAWKLYLNEITETARARDSRTMMGGLDESGRSNSGGNGEAQGSSPLYKFGKDLQVDIESTLNDEQKQQLLQLREEASKIRK